MQEVGPGGFSKDLVQVASEIARCTSVEEGVWKSRLRGRGTVCSRGSSAGEVASGGQGAGRGAGEPLSGSGTWPQADHFPFPLQLLPLDNISSFY